MILGIWVHFCKKCIHCVVRRCRIYERWTEQNHKFTKNKQMTLARDPKQCFKMLLRFLKHLEAWSNIWRHLGGSGGVWRHLESSGGIILLLGDVESMSGKQWRIKSWQKHTQKRERETHKKHKKRRRKREEKEKEQNTTKKLNSRL